MCFDFQMTAKVAPPKGKKEHAFGMTIEPERACSGHLVHGQKEVVQTKNDHQQYKEAKSRPSQKFKEPCAISYRI